jgi:hypothetical protein
MRSCNSRKQNDLEEVSSPPGRGSLSVAWRESDAPDEWDELIAQARFHDLLVLGGGSERHGRLPSEALGSIAVAAGRPVVLAPQQVRD